MTVLLILVFLTVTALGTLSVSANANKEGIWTRFQIKMTNWSWQDTFDVMINSWLINYLSIAFYLTIHYIMEMRRSMCKLHKSELKKQRDRVQRLELARERAAQPKPWRPKPKKKRHKKKDDWSKK
ncbi:hypothetical protein ACROYT_G007536 [Oculina patagonica]